MLVFLVKTGLVVIVNMNAAAVMLAANYGSVIAWLGQPAIIALTVIPQDLHGYLVGIGWLHFAGCAGAAASPIAVRTIDP